jgi:hypothetical protein
MSGMSFSSLRGLSRVVSRTHSVELELQLFGGDLDFLHGIEEVERPKRLRITRRV